MTKIMIGYLLHHGRLLVLACVHDAYGHMTVFIIHVWISLKNSLIISSLQWCISSIWPTGCQRFVLYQLQ